MSVKQQIENRTVSKKNELKVEEVDQSIANTVELFL